MSPFLTRLVNVALRGATLASKFGLIFALAYYLEPSDVGLYGLLFSAVSYSLYVVGLEFYVFSTRQLIALNKDVWGRCLKSHAVLILFLYLIFFPMLYSLFAFGLLPKNLLVWFFVILVLEHFSQEFNRLLIASSKQVAASFVLFFRSGVWCIAIVIAMYFHTSFRSLDAVFFSWAIGAGLACLISMVILFKMRLGGWKNKANWRWVKSGVFIALPFLLASLSVRGIFTFDRFFLEHYADLEVLGAYVLFVGICNSLVSFLDSSVFVFAYPVLIKSFQDGKADLFVKTMKRLSVQTAIISGVFVFSALLMIDLVLELIGKTSYIDNKGLFYLTLLAVFIFVAGFVPQYGLYAQGHDRPIIISSILSVIVFIFFVYFFSKYISYWAVPVGMIIAFSVSFLWKAVSYFKLTPRFSLKQEMG